MSVGLAGAEERGGKEAEREREREKEGRDTREHFFRRADSACGSTFSFPPLTFPSPFSSENSLSTGKNRIIVKFDGPFFHWQFVFVLFREIK